MQKFIAKYALAAHLAVLAVAPLFLSPGWIVWLSCAGALWLFMEPSKVKGEGLRAARKRVVGAIAKDPFFWLSLTLLAYAVLVLVNSGVSLSFDAERSEWFMASAPMPLLPASADGSGEGEAAGLLALTVVVQGCRHALGKNARLAFLTMASFLSGVCALVMTGFLFYGNGSMSALLNCDVSKPEYIGCAFGVYSLGASSALAGIFENRWFKNLFFVWVGVVGTVAGTFLFAPPYAAFLFAAAHIVLFLYSFVYAFKEMGVMAEFKYTVVFFLALAVAAVTVFFVLPEDVMMQKTSPWTTGAFLAPEMLEIRENLSRIAFSAWHKTPWLGTGLGTFALDIKFNASEAAFAVIPPAQSMPLNGYWKLLAENGIVGAVLQALLYGFLVFTFIRRLVSGIKAAFPVPLCVAGILSLAVVAAESVLDCSFLVPGTMVALCSLTALSAASFSRGVK